LILLPAEKGITITPSPPALQGGYRADGEACRVSEQASLSSFFLRGQTPLFSITDGFGVTNN